ncbi:hypothetical protein AB0J38_01740 [Streptomyces sp. NPDC050095]|uniref:hypothetical protein n=1 Tax=unclassified Streptomyces TaxID=2593676 RepID=UPI0034227BAE
MVNRAAIVGVGLVVIGGWAASGCSAGSAPDRAEEEPSVSLPAGYVDPMTAADKQFKCLAGTPFNALTAQWSATRSGKTVDDPQEIDVEVARADDSSRTLTLRRESWREELRPADAESKGILIEYKCPVTW